MTAHKEKPPVQRPDWGFSGRTTYYICLEMDRTIHKPVIPGEGKN